MAEVKLRSITRTATSRVGPIPSDDEDANPWLDRAVPSRFVTKLSLTELAPRLGVEGEAGRISERRLVEVAELETVLPTRVPPSSRLADFILRGAKFAAQMDWLSYPAATLESPTSRCSGFPGARCAE